jgi:hypothetical protein
VPVYAERASDAGTATAAAALAFGGFETAHRVLGTIIGETLGYTLTALWTLLVVSALGPARTSRWFRQWGWLSAVLILTGVLVPLDIPGADEANLAGYVMWSVWLLVLSLRLMRREDAWAGRGFGQRSFRAAEALARASR